MRFACILAIMLVFVDCKASVHNWNNSCSAWHFNPDNTRDPTIIFNNTGNATGVCPGYDGTRYAFEPCNFSPNWNVLTGGNWTTIPLDQFGVPATAKEIILTGELGSSGWQGAVYFWARATGSTWDLSPIAGGIGYVNFSVHAPVGIVNGVPAVDVKWALFNFTTGETGWLGAILSGYCE